MSEVTKELLEKVKTEAQEAIKGALAVKADASEIEKLVNRLTEAESKLENKELKEEVIRIAGELKAFKEDGKGGKVTAKTTLEMLKEKAADLAVLKEKKGVDVNFEVVKSAGTMTTANVLPSASNGIIVSINDPESGISRFSRSMPFIQELFTARPTNGNTISYAEMVNADGGAGMTGEGSDKTQADFDIQEAKVNVRKVTSFIKTSKEALEDVDALAAEIDNELMTLVELKADAGVLSGDGLSNNLKGVLEYAQTFAGTDYAGTILAPNNFDVLAAAASEVMTAEVITGEPAGFLPNVIVLHPVDFVKMKLTKTDEGAYVFPFQMPGVTDVIDVPVVKNPRMTEGSFLVMDSTKGNLRIREATNINIGYDGNDFTKNLVTILAEKRLAFYVKSQHVKAFVKGEFDTAKAVLALV